MSIFKKILPAEVTTLVQGLTYQVQAVLNALQVWVPAIPISAVSNTFCRDTSCFVRSMIVL